MSATPLDHMSPVSSGHTLLLLLSLGTYASLVRYIELLSKHKPKVHWDQTNKEHYIQFKSVCWCHREVVW